jgi:hypothetical protein
MTGSPEPERIPDLTQAAETSVAPIEPADWVKPVELIELLQRRTEKRSQVKAPTSSPFYDTEFVAKHRKIRMKRKGRTSTD